MTAPVEVVVEEFISYAEALKALGLWSLFEEQNRELVDELCSKVGVPCVR